MKKVLLVLMVMVSMVSLGEEFNFRKTKWGMRKEEVKKTETGEITIDEVENLAYDKIKLAGLRFTIFYNFKCDKLVSCTYIAAEKYSNKNNYDVDYFKMKEILDKKYGKVENENYWSRDLYKGDYNRRGTAISIGDLERMSIWELEETQIRLVIRGNNYKIIQGIVYQTKDKELLNIEKKIKEKEINDAF